MSISHIFRFAVLALTLLLLGGCATVQPTVNIPTDFSAKSDFNPVIGIALTPAPKPDTIITGTAGLLDIAIISAANGKLSDHLKTLDTSEFNAIQDDLAGKLQKRGFKTVKINQKINIEKLPKAKTKGKDLTDRDFSSLKGEHKIDQILLIQLTSIGTKRPYYGPMPMAAPDAYAAAHVQLIDISTGKLTWFETLDKTQPIPGAWDEPDKGFPNLTNSVYQALDAVRLAVDAKL